MGRREILLGGGSEVGHWKQLSKVRQASGARGRKRIKRRGRWDRGGKMAEERREWGRAD